MDNPTIIKTAGQINDQVTLESMPKFFNKKAKPVINKIVPINILKSHLVCPQAISLRPGANKLKLIIIF